MGQFNTGAEGTDGGDAGQFNTGAEAMWEKDLRSPLNQDLLGQQDGHIPWSVFLRQ